jgi:hypothetical protein
VDAITALRFRYPQPQNLPFFCDEGKQKCFDQFRPNGQWSIHTNSHPHGPKIGGIFAAGAKAASFLRDRDRPCGMLPALLNFCNGCHVQFFVLHTETSSPTSSARSDVLNQSTSN